MLSKSVLYSYIKLRMRESKIKLVSLCILCAAGVNDAGGKFATGVNATGGSPWVANIFANFPGKIETALTELSGIWEWMIHEKT